MLITFGDLEKMSKELCGNPKCNVKLLTQITKFTIGNLILQIESFMSTRCDAKTFVRKTIHRIV